MGEGGRAPLLHAHTGTKRISRLGILSDSFPQPPIWGTENQRLGCVYYFLKAENSRPLKCIAFSQLETQGLGSAHYVRIAKIQLFASALLLTVRPLLKCKSLFGLAVRPCLNCRSFFVSTVRHFLNMMSLAVLAVHQFCNCSYNTCMYYGHSTRIMCYRAHV